jgi:hypothetical protein
MGTQSNQARQPVTLQPVYSFKDKPQAAFCGTPFVKENLK